MENSIILYHKKDYFNTLIKETAENKVSEIFKNVIAIITKIDY